MSEIEEIRTLIEKLRQEDEEHESIT